MIKPPAHQPSWSSAGSEALSPDAPTIGIDLGGTKIEAIVLHNGQTRAKRRVPTPRHDYAATLRTLRDITSAVASDAGLSATVPVGLAMPGALCPATARVQNANSTWLNGKPLHTDLSALLERPLRLANDANCFALSEAADGAGHDAHLLFAVILGTGCGGGIVHAGRLIDGPRGIGGEWGHNPLPWLQPDEYPGPACWCGRKGCLETWISGPGLAADHARVTGQHLPAEAIVQRAHDAASGDQNALAARATLERHADRLARGLAHVVNLLDPDTVVLGGGLSNLPHLYAELPRRIAPFLFADDRRVDVRPPRHGDASGARGAAWLWYEPSR